MRLKLRRISTRRQAAQAHRPPARPCGLATVRPMHRENGMTDQRGSVPLLSMPSACLGDHTPLTNQGQERLWIERQYENREVRNNELSFPYSKQNSRAGILPHCLRETIFPARLTYQNCVRQPGAVLSFFKVPSSTPLLSHISTKNAKNQLFLVVPPEIKVSLIFLTADGFF